MSIRVLLIGPTEPIGGATVSFRYLVDELAQRDDVTLRVIATRGQDGASGQALARETARFLGQLLAAVPHCDVVSLHGSTRRFLVYGAIARAVALAARKPLLLRVFGSSIAEVLTARGGLAALVPWVMGAEGILLQCQALLADVRERYPAARVAWFPTSRPLPAATPSAPRTRRGAVGPLRAAFVGHVRAEKGVLALVEAARRLGPEVVQVDVYGRRYDNVRIADLEGMAHVRYHGEIAAEDVPGRLASADVLVLPTRFGGEGYPGVVIEAFQMGLPVVTSRFRFLPELVIDGVRGALVEPDDPCTLADALARLHQDVATYDRLAEGAFRAGRYFESARWNGDYFMSCVRALAGGSGPPCPPSAPSA